MKTIRQQLLLGLLCATLLCATGAIAMLYHSLLEETNELADLQLRQLAAALPNEFAANSGLPVAEDPEEEYVIQAWDQRGALLHASPGRPLLPRYQVHGFSAVSLHGERWRIYGETRHDRYVQVAQLTSARDKLAASMALRACSPLLVFVVILAGLVLVVVGRALRPLERLAQAVAGRSPTVLQPLDSEGLSPELRPIVLALNGLLGKFDDALTAQRIFVADAAHELRSPLAALKLQLQLLERASNDEARAQALARLHERLDRSTRLVQQLLSLARHETGYTAAHIQAVDLGQLLQTAVMDHSAFADSRAIDLGVEASGTSDVVLVQANKDSLHVLLNNLVDNALRYTQQGGRVDLLASYENGRAVLCVRDNGPGVAESYRARLFDRFYRPDGNEVWGCGLGLSIVRNIADHHRADIYLTDSPAGHGLTVTVVFP